MTNICDNPENLSARPGLYRVWLETQHGGSTRLVSLWVDPAMPAFEPRVGLGGAELDANPVFSLDDEPPASKLWTKMPSWFLVGQ